MSSPIEPLDLRAAEAALERGDYGQCLELLVPLAKSHPLPGAHGARVRLLMVTAWMGQGNESEAIATCRLLTGRDPKLRQQAKQLLGILEAPSLDRPERWSMRMPQLELNGSGEQTSTMRRRRSRRPEPRPTTHRADAFTGGGFRRTGDGGSAGDHAVAGGCVQSGLISTFEARIDWPHLGCAEHPGTPAALAGAI